MAEVFLAWQTGFQGFQKQCVVKRMKPGLVEDTAYVEMFLDEARVAARLTHPGIVQILDFGKEGDTYFIAMEHVPGANLQTILEAMRSRSQPVPIPLAAKLIALVASALDHVHRATDENGEPLRIVHRDVSPHNIMVSSTGDVKLIDFGIAKAADAFHRTEVGTLKGKFAYMSPEQLVQEPLDYRADIYSLGLVLYELLAGVPAVSGNTHATILANAHRRMYTPLDRVRPMVPDAVKAVLDRALEVDPNDRFESAAEMGDTLEEYLAHAEIHVRPLEFAWLLAKATDLTPLETNSVPPRSTGPRPMLRPVIPADSGVPTLDANMPTPSHLVAQSSIPPTRPTVLPPTKPSLPQFNSLPPTKPSQAATARTADDRPPVQRSKGHDDDVMGKTWVTPVRPLELPTPVDGSMAASVRKDNVSTDPNNKIASVVDHSMYSPMDRTAVDQLMRTDPAQPPPDIEAAMGLDAHTELAGVAPVKPAPEPTSLVASRRPRRRRLWPWMVLTPLVLLIGVEVFLLTPAAAPVRASLRVRFGPALERAGLGGLLKSER
jgi:serine/threonine protein kinase